MRKRISVPALLLALSVLGLPAGSAQADTTTSLPITSFAGIVADPAHSHLFISQGNAGGILVTNLAGQQAATIAGQDSVRGMALSPDGKTLYAADESSHAVTAIDTATLQQTASYPLGNGDTPAWVAVQSGKVWVSYDTGSAGSAAVGDIDLSAAAPAFQTQAATGGWYSAPEIAADPHDTGVLIAVEAGQDPSAVASYSVSADPVTVTAQSSFFQACSGPSDLAVVPGGSQFIMACASPQNAHYLYSTADLSQQGSYASTAWPTAVALDASGDVAAGSQGYTSAPDLFLYHAGGGTPLQTYNLSGSNTLTGLLARGLAWSADGSKLFAVLETTTTSASQSNTYSLRVIDYPALARSSLSLTGPSNADPGKAVTLTGSLTLGTGTAPPTGTTITVTRSVPGGADRTFSLATAADGSFSLTDTPPAMAQYTYTASYAGDGTYAPATASQPVLVGPAAGSLALSPGSKSLLYKPTIHLTATLGPTSSNHTVSIYAQPAGSKTRTLLKTGTVDAYGQLSVSYTAAHNTTFSAVFTGDQNDAPQTVTELIDIRAKVSESVGGYYKRTTSGGTTWWLYHHTHKLSAHATVAPRKPGQCVKFEVQEYHLGTWQPNLTSGCIKLSSASAASATFGLTKAGIGNDYRIRADYIPSSKDITNAGYQSNWQYLIVEK